MPSSSDRNGEESEPFALPRALTFAALGCYIAGLFIVNLDLARHGVWDVELAKPQYISGWHTLGRFDRARHSLVRFRDYAAKRVYWRFTPPLPALDTHPVYHAGADRPFGSGRRLRSSAILRFVFGTADDCYQRDAILKVAPFCGWHERVLLRRRPDISALRREPLQVVALGSVHWPPSAESRSAHAR